MQNKLKYFKIFESIHSQMFKESYGTRCNHEIKYKIDSIIKNLIIKNYSLEKDIDKFINGMAIIYLYQPFFDGNHRTVLGLMYYILKRKGYLLDVDNLWNNYLNGICYIPIFYSDQDQCSNECKKYIKNNIRKFN